MKIPICSFILGLLLFSACGKPNTTSIKKGKKNQKAGFVKGAFITKDETFSGIKSNVARLQAMICGEFVQYNERKSDGKVVYKTWKVNDGKDSVLQYTLPVGDPQKIGYWLYHYQVITSLPDEPIFEAFEKLETVDRDTIISTFYKVPENFNPPLEELKKKHRNAFASIDVSKLKLDEAEGKNIFVRQNPLFFKGTSTLVLDPQNKLYTRYVYEIKPSGMMMYTEGYKTLDAKQKVRTSSEKFVKSAMVR